MELNCLTQSHQQSKENQLEPFAMISKLFLSPSTVGSTELLLRNCENGLYRIYSGLYKNLCSDITIMSDRTFEICVNVILERVNIAMDFRVENRHFNGDLCSMIFAKVLRHESKTRIEI